MKTSILRICIRLTLGFALSWVSLSSSPALAEDIAPLLHPWSAVQARHDLIFSPDLVSLDVQVSELTEDTTGLTFLAALLARASEVKVRLLLDRHHTGKQDPMLFEYVRRKGIEVREFNRLDLDFPKTLVDAILDPVAFGTQLMKTLNERMHGKGVLAEFKSGNLAMIGGGYNMDDLYFSQTSKRKWKKGDFTQSNQYIDLDYYLEGPGLADYRTYLNEINTSSHVAPLRPLKVSQAKWDVYEKKMDGIMSEKLDQLHQYAESLKSKKRDWRKEMIHGVKARFLHDDLTDRNNGPSVSRELLAEAMTTKSKLTLGSPFGALSDNVLKMMKSLRSRGKPIQVEYLTNSSEQNESAMIARDFNDLVPTLLDMGVEVSQMAHRMIHAKIFRKDTDVTALTTNNFDRRSDQLNFEIGWLIQSEALAERVDRWLVRVRRLAQKRTTIEDPHPRLPRNGLKNRAMEFLKYHAAPHLKRFL